MAAKKTSPQLTSVALGINAPVHNIYVNEHLTPKTKGLLKRAKDLRNKGYKYIWCREGKVLVRRTDTAEVTQYKCANDVILLESQ